MEIEVLSPQEREYAERHGAEDFDGPRVRVFRVGGGLGLLGAGVALLTMAAAVGVGLLALCGTTLLGAVLAYELWPMLFSAEFSRFVFGAERAPFWKLFLLFMLAGAAIKLSRRLLGGR